MKNNSFNSRLWFALGFIAILVSSMFAGAHSAANSDLWKMVFKILAGLVPLGLSIGMALAFWKKDVAGNYLEATGLRWVSLFAVLLGVFALLFLIMYPGR